MLYFSCPDAPANDLRWVEWCAPLREFLRGSDRSWTDLKEWRKSQGLGMNTIRELMAWLSFNGIADWDQATERWGIVVKDLPVTLAV